jgi:transposase
MARPSKYTPELRRRAVEEVLDRGRKVAEVATSLGITTPETLRRWVVLARIDRGMVVGPTTEELAEIKALRREVSDQQRTIEILKAATTFFVQEADPNRRRRSHSSTPTEAGSRSRSCAGCSSFRTHPLWRVAIVVAKLLFEAFVDDPSGCRKPRDRRAPVTNPALLVLPRADQGRERPGSEGQWPPRSSSARAMTCSGCLS